MHRRWFNWTGKVKVPQMGLWWRAQPAVLISRFIWMQLKRTIRDIRIERKEKKKHVPHTGSKFEMDVATFGLDFLEECTTQGRTRSPSDGVPLFQGSFCSIIPWPIRWHEYDTLQMILGIFRHHGAHSCRLSGSNNLLMWLAQHGCLRTELNQFVANS